MRAWITFSLCLLAALLPRAAWGQQLTGGGSLEIPFLRIVLALVMAIGVAVVAAYLLRRSIQDGRPAFLAKFAGADRGRRIDIIEVRRISISGEVCLLACEGTEYLVVLNQSGCTVLSERRASNQSADC